ncbi:MAG: DUF3048 domain-containing protein [Clostridia bacterium]|nr:DUF3048 domain-containing protein [Clostridia bacterium]
MNAKKISVLILIVCAALVLCCACLKKAEKPDDTTLEDTTVEDTTAETTESLPETDAPEEPKVPEFFNPLTGLGVDKDLSKKRPASVMINNINVSLPQEGIAQADIMYECLAEGGITRLMMISTEYEKLSKVGSVRSARDYYIDYADGYDCIFVHAGGSTYAYNTIANRKTNNIDDVSGKNQTGSGSCFIRDPERSKKFSYEHTLMLKSGELLSKAVSYYGYRTEKSAGYEKPMNFAEFGTTVSPDTKAKHVRVVMSSYQKVDYVYSEETGEYLRYQYNGQPHMDAAIDKQLAFKNVVLIYTNTAAIPGDEKDRINVGTTGTGEGWFITEGGYEKITWKKESAGAVLKFFRADGTEVAFNRGKTMINVVPTYNASYTVFDDNWKDK